MRFGEGLVEHLEFLDSRGKAQSLPMNAQVAALARAMHTPLPELARDIHYDLVEFHGEHPSEEKLATALTTAIAEIASLAFEESGRLSALRYRPYIGVLSRDFRRISDPGDAIKGIDWWNSAGVDERRHWLERAGSTRPEDAWHKRQAELGE